MIWFTYAVVFELSELRGTSWIPSVIPWLDGKNEPGMWADGFDTKTFAIYQVRAERCGGEGGGGVCVCVVVTAAVAVAVAVVCMHEDGWGAQAATVRWRTAPGKQKKKRNASANAVASSQGHRRGQDRGATPSAAAWP